MFTKNIGRAVRIITLEEARISLLFLSVPGMALIQSEIVRPQVVTAKCSEPQADTIKVGVKEVV